MRERPLRDGLTPWSAPAQVARDLRRLSKGRFHLGMGTQVRIRVESERYATHETVPVTEAHLTMVSIGPDGRPIAFASPSSLVPEP